MEKFLENKNAEWSQISKPSIEWQQFYKSNGHEVPTLIGTSSHMRTIMAQLKVRAAMKVPKITEGLSVNDEAITMSDGAEIMCRVYKPSAETLERGPSVIYIHGGGWTLGDLDSEDGVCRLMCSQARVVVISPDYRLAPEYPYPICFSDSWETLLWTIKNSEDLGIDASQVIIAGSSAGGNLAAAVVHQARVENVMLAGQILRIPSTCHIDLLPSEGLSSMVENADAPLLSRRSMEIFWSNYNPPKDKLLHHTVSPLLASTFKGLPPTYVQVAGLDPLRDEGLRYAKRLLEAGVPMKLDVYPGVPHAFGYFPELDAAKANARDLIQGLQWIKSLK